MAKELFWFLMGLTLVLIIPAMAVEAVAQTATDLASKDADEIMANWDSLSSKDRETLVEEIAKSEDALKLGEMYGIARGGQGEQVIGALSEDSALKMLNKVEIGSEEKVMKLIQALETKTLEKFMTFNSTYNQPEPKLLTLDMASLDQLRYLLPRLETSLKGSLITNTEDPEVITVVLELLEGKCGASKKGNSSTHKSKKKDKDKEKECSDPEGSCSVPIDP